jgi:hypothetical protein
MQIEHEAESTSGRPQSERTWVLLEFVTIAILSSVAATVIGGLVGAVVYSHGSSGFGNASGWLAIEFGTRWVTPPLAGLLVASMAVSWMSFGQWVGPNQDASPTMIRIHVRRLLHLLTFTQVTALAVTVGAILSAVSVVCVDQQTVTGVPNGQLLGADLYGVFNALGVVLLLGVTAVATRRLRGACVKYLARAASTDAA